MKTIHEKIVEKEPITKADVVRVLKEIKRDVSIVKKDVEHENPKALEHIDYVLNKVKRTLIDETMRSVRRGKTLLDVSLKISRNSMELGQQHKDIIEMKKIINEVDTMEKKVYNVMEKIAEKTGNLFGLNKRQKVHTKVSTKQLKMLEIIDLDETLNPQDQKILRYLIIKKYDYKNDEFIPAYFNEIKKNARVYQGVIKKKLNLLLERGC